MSESQEPIVESQELDLGIEVPAAPVIDLDIAISKVKPDFQRVVKLLGIQPVGATQEEVEADLLNKQLSYESDLKNNLVPKIQAAIQSTNQNKTITPKPGVSVTPATPEFTRKLKPWRGY
ncbi:hypothetical protein [Nostoc sp.]|uniref:hypothetical protein n=1 Tax=Nostoc sp. TaxID=1180 RepID=UPI002FFCFE1B